MEMSLEDSQGERTLRAQEALAEGFVTVSPSEEPSQWIVQFGDHEPNKVVLRDEGDYSCTCWDYSRVRKSGLRCKHIEAVKLTAIKLSESNTILQDHKEVRAMTDNNEGNGWVKLFHPVAGGIQVTLPLMPTAVTEDQAKGMFNSVSNYLKAGFVTIQAGLEEGETKESVTHLAKRIKINNDEAKSKTPIIDVYCNGNFKVVGIYLNTLEDVEAFNDAFGIGLNSIPEWEGDASIERGKNADRDKKFIVPVSGVDVVYKLNPRYEGEDDKKHAKRMFVRWESKAPKAASKPAVSATPTPQPAPAVPTAAPVAPPVPPTPVPAVSVDQNLKDMGFPPSDSPKPLPTVKTYGDGTAVSSSETEIYYFDKFIADKGKNPANKEELRSYRDSLVSA